MKVSRSDYYLKNVEPRVEDNQQFHILYNLGVAEEKQYKIVNYSKGYASCNHKSKLGYALYRTKQVFCAIVGQSDWQKARRLLVKELKKDHISAGAKLLPGKAQKKMSDIIIKNEINVYKQAKANCILREGAAEEKVYDFDPIAFQSKVGDMRAQLLKKLGPLVQKSLATKFNKPKYTA